MWDMGDIFTVYLCVCDPVIGVGYLGDIGVMGEIGMVFMCVCLSRWCVGHGGHKHGIYVCVAYVVGVGLIWDMGDIRMAIVDSLRLCRRDRVLGQGGHWGYCVHG